MNPSEFRAYDIDDCITEIYDQIETQREDICVLRSLIGGEGRLRILEPFCGNGRILIPLAEDGHEMVGMDKSEPMLASASRKIGKLPEDVQERITLVQADVTTDPWPDGFSLVILGANCFYELPTRETQEHCIRAARTSLEVGGHLYLDNNHMEGDLDPSWRKRLVEENRFPTGTCSDGTQVKGTAETVWYDVPERLVRIRRTVEIRAPDGEIRRKEWVEQKHPPSTAEMQDWLEKHGFVVEHLWGDRKPSLYTDESGRAIFWCRPVAGDSR